MQRRRLGQLEVSAVGLGCGTMTPFYGEPDRAAGIATIRRAREIGVDFLDTADGYGRGRNEELIGEAVREHRGDYVIASKFGNLGLLGDPRFADGRPEYVREACEKSLGRLKTDVIDLYYIHRVDPTVPIEDTIGAMSELVREGKVRFLGICEAGAATIRRANAVHPLAALQIEYSLWTRDVESEIVPLCEATRSAGLHRTAVIRVTSARFTTDLFASSRSAPRLGVRSGDNELWERTAMPQTETVPLHDTPLLTEAAVSRRALLSAGVGLAGAAAIASPPRRRRRPPPRRRCRESVLCPRGQVCSSRRSCPRSERSDRPYGYNRGR